MNTMVKTNMYLYLLQTVAKRNDWKLKKYLTASNIARGPIANGNPRQTSRKCLENNIRCQDFAGNVWQTFAESVIE